FRADTPEYPLKLVLIGSLSMDVPAHPDIVTLGFVSEAQKDAAFAAASIVVQPSSFESLSLVALEAWAVGTPVLVNTECDVTRDQCVRSNGGLWYGDYEEVRGELRLLLENPELRERLGSAGREFVEHNYAWEAVERKLIDVVARAMEGESARTTPVVDHTRLRERWIGSELLARVDVIRGTRPG